MHYDYVYIHSFRSLRATSCCISDVSCQWEGAIFPSYNLSPTVVQQQKTIGVTPTQRAKAESNNIC